MTPSTQSTANPSAPVTPLSGDWIVTLAMYRAALAAGFTVSPIKESETRRGIAWQATLSLNGVKVIEASNDGDGGADWIDPVFKSANGRDGAAREAAERAREALFALPEVHTFLAAFDIDVKKRGGATAEEALALVAQSGPRVAQDDDAVGHVISTLAEVRKLLPRLKKVTESGIHFARATHQFGQYASVKTIPDTPHAREKVRQKWPDEFAVFQGFIPDLIAGL